MAAGKLGLASIVQYVPLPTIGGYLAFVGLFCLKSGVTLATGVAVSPTLPAVQEQRLAAQQHVQCSSCSRSGCLQISVCRALHSALLHWPTALCKARPQQQC